MNQNYFSIYRKTVKELAFKCYLVVGLFLGIVTVFDCQNSPKNSEIAKLSKNNLNLFLKSFYAIFKNNNQ